MLFDLHEHRDDCIEIVQAIQTQAANIGHPYQQEAERVQQAAAELVAALQNIPNLPNDKKLLSPKTFQERVSND